MPTNDAGGVVRVHTNRQGSKRETEDDSKILKKLRDLQRYAHNRRCADCGELGTMYVCVTLGSFVCTSCAGVHRELNHKVKGISVSVWTNEEIDSIECRGNEVVNSEYLERAKQEDQPHQFSDVQRLRSYLRDKYVEKRWCKQRASTPSNQREKPRIAKKLSAHSKSTKPNREDFLLDLETPTQSTPWSDGPSGEPNNWSAFATDTCRQTSSNTGDFLGKDEDKNWGTSWPDTKVEDLLLPSSPPVFPLKNPIVFDSSSDMLQTEPQTSFLSPSPLPLLPTSPAEAAPTRQPDLSLFDGLMSFDVPTINVSSLEPAMSQTGPNAFNDTVMSNPSDHFSLGGICSRVGLTISKSLDHVESVLDAYSPELQPMKPSEPFCTTGFSFENTSQTPKEKFGNFVLDSFSPVLTTSKPQELLSSGDALDSFISPSTKQFSLGASFPQQQNIFDDPLDMSNDVYHNTQWAEFQSSVPKDTWGLDD